MFNATTDGIVRTLFIEQKELKLISEFSINVLQYQSPSAVLLKSHDLFACSGVLFLRAFCDKFYLHLIRSKLIPVFQECLCRLYNGFNWCSSLAILLPNGL